MSMELILLGSIVGGLSAVVLGVYKYVSPLAPFLYANAKIMARSNYLMDESKKNTLIQAKSLEELSTKTHNLLDMPVIESKGGLRKFHSGVEKAFIEKMLELKKISPKKMQEIITAYLMIWESKILKTFYRALSYKQREELDEALVFPIGSIDSVKLQRLKEAETINDLNQIMTDSPYEKVFEEEYESVLEFEIAIDRFVFHNFVNKVKEKKIQGSKEIIELVNRRIDILNIFTLIKAKSRGIKGEKIEKLMIKNDTELCKRIKKLAQAKTLKEMVEECEKTPCYEPLKKSLSEYEEDQSLLHFERNLWKHYLKEIESKELEFVQGSYPLFSYLISKEFELKNLFAISNGIKSGYSRKEMESVLI